MRTPHAVGFRSVSLAMLVASSVAGCGGDDGSAPVASNASGGGGSGGTGGYGLAGSGGSGAGWATGGNSGSAGSAGSGGAGAGGSAGAGSGGTAGGGTGTGGGTAGGGSGGTGTGGGGTGGTTSSGGTGGGGTGGTPSSGGTGGGSSITLKPSGPVVVTKDGQVVENLKVTTGEKDGCGIKVVGRKNVTIRNVHVLHKQIGICVEGSSGVHIESVKVESTSAPATGPHCTFGVKDCWNDKNKWENPDVRLGIRIGNSSTVSISKTYFRGSSSGMFIVKSPATLIDQVICEDMRGPFPRGQCVQFLDSNNAKITNFYAKNYKNKSYSEDNINAYRSDNIQVAHGLIDGNWSINGLGIIADTGSDDMKVSDVDIVDTGCGAVGVWSNDATQVGKNFRAEDVRVRDTHCDARQGGVPSSGGLVYTNHPNSMNPIFKNITYFNHCRAMVGYCTPGASCRQNATGSITGLVEANFTARKPIALNFAW